ncbi:MAG: cation:proton antiporter [Gammaproteobacteria bacterium]|nr:cation:proton antiporter [Gammaproteobacteria bacterium]
MPLSETLFIILLLLILALLLSGLCRHLPLPYTILLVVTGVSINLLATVTPFALIPSGFHLSDELVLFIFHPALIFFSALSLDARTLIKDLIPILVMAIPGMLISALLVATGLNTFFYLDFLLAFLFGAIISATDPVAVIALFKELGVSKRLTVLVEGESLFNDATAIVLFNIVLGAVIHGESALMDAPTMIYYFTEHFLLGALIGTLIGLLISELMVRMYHGQQSFVVVASIVAAYLSFIVAEHNFHASGIMSVLATALCIKGVAMPRLSGESTHHIEAGWDSIALVLNSLLFLLIGLTVDILAFAIHWQQLIWVLLAIFAARMISVYGLIPMTTSLFSLPAINLNSRHMMWWGCSKGTIAIAMALAIPDTVVDKGLLLELTLGMVLISLVMSGPTLKPLMRALKIDRLNDDEWLELQEGMEQITTSVNDCLHSFSRLHLLESDMQDSVLQSLNRKIAPTHATLTEAQQLRQIHLHALNVEERELQRLHEIGLVNYYTYLNFKDILRKDKAKSIDEMIRFNRNQDNVNPFLRFEMSIIKFLSEYEWTLNWLIRYQKIRFANLIRHDLAGVLMAHEALLALKQVEPHFHSDKLNIIRKIYRQRLERRQGRLKKLGKQFHDFYYQFEYRLFQEVALRYSLKLITEDFEHGKLSEKIYRRLEKRLDEALKQLPDLAPELSLAKRDDWLDNVPIFSGLPRDVLKKLAKNAHYVSFLPNDTIFNENDRGDSIYILVNGVVNVFQNTGPNQRVHIAELRKGSFIGRHALYERAVRTATVRAKTYVTLLRLTTQDIKNLSKALPELNQRLQETNINRYPNNT